MRQWIVIWNLRNIFIFKTRDVITHAVFIWFLLQWWSTMIERNVGTKGLFQVTNLRSQSFAEGSQSREQKLLTSFLLLAFSGCFLTQLRTTCWGVAWSTACWVLPHRLIHSGIAAQACPQVSLEESFSELKFLLPKWLCLVSSSQNQTSKLTKQPTSNHQLQKKDTINVEDCGRWQEEMKYDLCVDDILLKGFWTFRV